MAVMVTADPTLPVASRLKKMGVVERLTQAIYFASGVVIALLALRFCLGAVGANPDNAFAAVVLALSYPFAAPFFTLFGSNPSLGVGQHVQFPLLVAMLMYALLAVFMAKMLRLVMAPSDPTGEAYRE